MSSAKAKYFADKAALLDPNAYVFLGNGASLGLFDEVVPTGETWYLIQGWHLWGSPVPVGHTLQTPYWFHRSGGVNGALALPAGARLRTNPANTQIGFAYVCKPVLVQFDPRYREPEDLYYSRLERLKTLTQYDLTAAIASGGAIGTSAVTPWPGGVASRVLVVHESMHDGSWITLAGTTDAYKVINLNYELSDYHQHRYGLTDFYPVRPADFDAGLVITNARIDGVAAGNSDLNCEGRIAYYELPADW